MNKAQALEVEERKILNEQNMSKSKVPETQQWKILNEFRDAVSDILKPDHDDEYLLRWLRARDFDLSNAETMIRKSSKFMYNIEAEDLLKTGYEIPKIGKETYIPTYFLGCDKEGSPVRLAQPGLLDLGGLSRAYHITDLMKMLIYIMQSDYERAKEDAKKTGQFDHQTVWLSDYSNFNMRVFFDRTIVMKVINLFQTYQDNFPELLKVVYIINVPPLFNTAFQVFKPFLHEKTWKKFRFFSSDSWKLEMMQHVDPKIIPKCYGGELDDPSYDPATYLQRTNGGKIPIQYYLTDDSYLRTTDPDVNTMVIKEKSFYHHSLNVLKPGTIITWIFQTKESNINFGVFFSASQDDSLGEEILKSKKVESKTIPERGEIFCDKIGQYCLRFDNTFSWIMKKRLLFKVYIRQPL